MFDAFYPERLLGDKFSDEIKNVTRSFLANILRPSRLPEVLYHYTNMTGFQGILDSGMVWATHIAYMNDVSEYRHAVVESGKISGELKRSESQSAKIKFYECMEGLLQPTNMRMQDYPPIFIACFSEAEDNLSQWRAYGGGEGGISLGFDMEFLQERIKDSAWLAPVIYNQQDQQQLIKEFLKVSANLYVKHASEAEDFRQEFFEMWYLNWRMFASQLAPFFKNPAFDDEKEWRIILPMDVSLLRFLFFRPTESVVIPTIKLRLGEAQRALNHSGEDAEAQAGGGDTEGAHPDKLPLKRIWIGPNKSMSLAQFGACCLLEKHGYELDEDAIKESTVPYRVAG
jgi:hypothetical protein